MLPSTGERSNAAQLAIEEGKGLVMGLELGHACVRTVIYAVKRDALIPVKVKRLRVSMLCLYVCMYVWVYSKHVMCVCVFMCLA